MIEEIIQQAMLDELSKIAYSVGTGITAPPKTRMPKMPGPMKKRPAVIGRYQPAPTKEQTPGMSLSQNPGEGATKSYLT